MKTSFNIYITGAICTLSILILAIVLFFCYPNKFNSICPLLFLGILGIPFITVLFGFAFSNQTSNDESQNDNKDESKEMVPAVPQKEGNKEIGMIVENEFEKDNINEAWCKAMYERFGEKWNTFFDGITYPADKSSRAEFVAIIWEIASLTMDYLLTENNDPSVLRRNKEMTKAIIKREKIENLDLKDFYNDPSTVPAKVIMIYDILSQMIASKQSFDLVAFGHQLHIGK